MNLGVFIFFYLCAVFVLYYLLKKIRRNEPMILYKNGPEKVVHVPQKTCCQYGAQQIVSGIHMNECCNNKLPKFDGTIQFERPTLGHTDEIQQHTIEDLYKLLMQLLQNK